MYSSNGSAVKKNLLEWNSALNFRTSSIWRWLSWTHQHAKLYVRVQFKCKFKNSYSFVSKLWNWNFSSYHPYLTQTEISWRLLQYQIHLRYNAVAYPDGCKCLAKNIPLLCLPHILLVRLSVKLWQFGTNHFSFYLRIPPFSMETLIRSHNQFQYQIIKKSN